MAKISAANLCTQCLRCVPYASQLLLFCVRAASMPRLCCFLTASKSIIICISASASVSQRRITIARFTCPSIEMLSRPHLVTLTRPIIDLNPTVEVYVISRKSFFCISSVCFFVNNYWNVSARCYYITRFLNKYSTPLYAYHTGNREIYILPTLLLSCPGIRLVYE